MASATTTNVPVTVETANVSSAPAASVPTTISVPSVTSSVTTGSGPSIDARDVMSIRFPTQTSVAASNVMPVVVSESQPIVDVPLQLGESESPMQVGSIVVQVLPNEPRPLLTAGMPLGHSLPQEIKQDIWEDKFVDLAALLYPNTHTSYGFRFSGDISDGQGELKLAPQRRKINTIADLSKAFSTFIAVYIEKPNREGDASQLLTYMAEVQSIAEDGLDWAMYDELYRRDRAGTKSPPSWAAINQSIHNKIMRQKVVWPPPPCPVYQQVIFKNSQTKNRSDSSKVHFDKETVSRRDSVMPTTHLKSSVCVKIAPTNTNVSNVGQEKNIPTSCVNKQNGTTKGLPTPIRIDVLTELLSGYDQSTSKFLIDGFSKGFSLKCQKPYDDVTLNNHQSLYDEPCTASDLINKELSANRISGPFDKKALQ